LTTQETVDEGFGAIFSAPFFNPGSSSKSVRIRHAKLSTVSLQNGMDIYANQTPLSSSNSSVWLMGAKWHSGLGLDAKFSPIIQTRHVGRRVQKKSSRPRNNLKFHHFVLWIIKYKTRDVACANNFNSDFWRYPKLFFGEPNTSFLW
jgi:hypothetical protein